MQPAPQKTTDKKQPLQPDPSKDLAYGDDKTVPQYTVFLIEDDPDDKKQIMKTLERSPYVYNVRSFASGEEMMAHFVTEGYFSGSVVHQIPVMILLDLHLPGTDGMEILRDLKDHPLTANIPVVITTGDTSQKCAFEAYKLQANAYITKPVHLGQIHDVIRSGWGWPMKEYKPQ